VLRAVESWLAEDGPDSAKLSIGDRSYTMVGPMGPRSTERTSDVIALTPQLVALTTGVGTVMILVGLRRGLLQPAKARRCPSFGLKGVQCVHSGCGSVVLVDEAAEAIAAVDIAAGR
jgi:hypothetical protein